MTKATFFFRTGGLIITEIDDNHNGKNIGQRLCTGGFIVGRDSLWEGREVVINLSDIICVILRQHNDSL